VVAEQRTAGVKPKSFGSSAVPGFNRAHSATSLRQTCKAVMLLAIIGGRYSISSQNPARSYPDILELGDTASSFWKPSPCFEECRCLCRLEWFLMHEPWHRPPTSPTMSVQFRGSTAPHLENFPCAGNPLRRPYRGKNTAGRQNPRQSSTPFSGPVRGPWRRFEGMASGSRAPPGYDSVAMARADWRVDPLPFCLLSKCSPSANVIRSLQYITIFPC
jgi:hypothetical protein